MHVLWAIANQGMLVSRATLTEVFSSKREREGTGHAY